MRFAIFFLFAAVIGLPSLTLAAPAEELRLFQRCYVHLTGKPIPLGDARINKLKTAQTTALKECYALLDNAKLQANGRPKVDTEESRQVLRQFFHFTRSWLPNTAQEQIAGFSVEYLWGTVDTFDMNAPAYAMTYYALREGAKYSDLLRGNRGFESIREYDNETRMRHGVNQTNVTRYLQGDNSDYARRFQPNVFAFRYSGPLLEGNYDTFRYTDVNNTMEVPNYHSTLVTLPRTPMGELAGIVPDTRNFAAPNFTLDPFNNAFVNERRGDLLPDVDRTRNMYQGFGGGVIGDPVFFMLNSGHPVGTLFNGSFKLPRRWSQTVQNIFLCIDPTLRKPVRSKDVTSMVITTSNRAADEAANWESIPGFRKQSSCMQCHASLDPMASTARNLIIASSDWGSHLDNTTASAGDGTKNTIFISSFTPNSSVTLIRDWPSYAAETNALTKMPIYARTAPTGALRYRTSEGELVSTPVANMEELGNAIASQDDFYRCTAKRYFYMFTGVDVNLFDRRDPVNEALNLQMDERAVQRRDLIQSMADELRKTQSIPNMLKVILRSPTYLDLNYKQGAQ